MADKPSGRGLTVPKNPAAMLRALNSRHGADETSETNKETDQQTNNTTILQTDIQAASAATEGRNPSTPAAQPDPEAIPPTEPQTNNQTNRQRNKPTKKQTNNTTEPSPIRRDGRTLRARQPASDPTSTIVTSFRISVGTMEALDRYCFENRVRKQDVVEQALAAFIGEDEE